MKITLSSVMVDDQTKALKTSLASADVRTEYERLTKRGVVFRTKPTRTGPVTVAVFDDTCGNLIQLHQV